MRRSITVLVLGILCLAAGRAVAEAPFEIVHAVKLPKGVYGYRGGMGDIIELKDGSLLFACSPPDQGIAAVTSTDGGKTWSEPAPMFPNPKPPAKGYYVLPGFLRLPGGDIMVSYIYATFPTTPYYGHNYYRRSSDEGKTWTEQFCMTPHPGYYIVHNDRLVLLSTGRILAPAEYKAHFPSDRDHSGYVGSAFFSDDGGFSWQVSKNTVDMMPVEFQEAHAVELKDKRVMLFARTYSGYPARAYSTDGGETWSKGEMVKEMSMPYAGLPTVARIPSTGDLLFLWITGQSDIKDSTGKRRTPLSSAISKDEGRTFMHQRNIAEDPEDDYGYQCLDFVGKDMALVGFHARDGLHVARIGIDWFYGK
ncbi:MAG: sialidase family protein [Planctomycetia bacterium]|nr:sialidase family protein [Planctomycetia bacterium]